MIAVEGVGGYTLPLKIIDDYFPVPNEVDGKQVGAAFNRCFEPLSPAQVALTAAGKNALAVAVTSRNLLYNAIAAWSSVPSNTKPVDGYDFSNSGLIACNEMSDVYSGANCL